MKFVVAKLNHAMFRKPSFAVVTVSTILLVYCVLLNSNAPPAISYFIFSISPFLIIWVAYTVLRFGIYEGKNLDEEEWGYQDKSKDELWVL
jgi:hypothetical protein